MLALREFEQFYDEMREKYLEWISNFGSWEGYLDNLKKFTCDPNYYPEELLQEFVSEVDEYFFEQYPFLKRYHPDSPEFKKYVTENEYSTFHLKSKLGGVKVFVELINIAREELHFPRIKWMASIHASLHSTATLIHVMSKYDFKSHGVSLHEVPKLTHVGDREYTSYYCEQLKSPLIILSREENASNLLERNGVPKIGNLGGRWCSRTDKTEPDQILSKRQFYPTDWRIQYGLSKAQILKVMDRQKVSYPKKLKSAIKDEVIAYALEKYKKGQLRSKSKSQYITQTDTYQQSFFNKETRSWELQEEESHKHTYYETIRNGGNQITDYREYGVSPINNVVEFIGIIKNQSPNRAKLNPNVKISAISKPDNQFLVFQHYPIFHLSYEDLKALVDPFQLKPNPYETMYRKFNEDKDKEVRFGCSLCPYKTEGFYKLLKEEHPEIYYYARLLKLLGSARNLVKGGEEYHYFQTSKIM